jgi:hypothetical protein
MEQEINQKIDLMQKDIAENKLMLNKILRFQKMSVWSKWIYWGIIITITLGAFAIVKPAINTLVNVYGLNSDISLVNVLKSNLETIQDLSENPQ